MNTANFDFTNADLETSHYNFPKLNYKVVDSTRQAKIASQLSKGHRSSETNEQLTSCFGTMLQIKSSNRISPLAVLDRHESPLNYRLPSITAHRYLSPIRKRESPKLATVKEMTQHSRNVLS